jgi:hypothetical protein
MKTHHLKNGSTRFFYGFHSADFAPPRPGMTDDELLSHVRAEAKLDRPTVEDFAAAQGLDPLNPSTSKDFARIHKQTKRLKALLGGRT